MRTRIVQLIASLDRGGAERVVVDLALGFDRDRYQTTVIYLQGTGELGAELTTAGINVVRLPDRGKLNPGTCRALYGWLRRERPDVLHCHIPRPAFWGLIAARAAGVPVRVYTEHSAQNYPLILGSLYPAIVRLATDLVCVSDAAQTTLRRHYPAVGGKTVTIRNGIRLARVSDCRDRCAVRTELGLGPDEPVLCHVANAFPVKAQHDLLNAFALARRLIPSARLLMVGDGPLRQELMELSRQLGLAEQVLFLGRRSDVADLLAASDLFVLSSVAEGLPVTIIEAMAAGLPVIATNVGGCAEIVQDQITGRIVPPRSPAQLAEAIAETLSDSRRATEMGRAGRSRAADNFAAEACVRAHEALYEEALARASH